MRTKRRVEAFDTHMFAQCNTSCEVSSMTPADVYRCIDRCSRDR
ncbi:hypothetical protein RBSWK_05169 [Rhodopirellula baltica SWK14]|uniref:Uncharacterized protein n=1 Tax=Rhodopirellula baltica SWK14 TaxID=993516 RepID=L7CA24_RHOBT|nr:hypothetical protein RBSWK_05169 [Rhodopirellula baltica SWK14]